VLENFAKVAAATSAEQQLDMVARHATMIVESSMASVPEAHDRADIQSAFEKLLGEADRARARLAKRQDEGLSHAV
jgi:hypothetical protein